MWFAVGHAIGAALGGLVLIVAAVLDEVRP